MKETWSLTLTFLAEREFTSSLYAANTSITVKVDGTECEENVSFKIPVAFSYAKFPIDKNGKLKQVVDEKEINVASTFAPTKSF